MENIKWWKFWDWKRLAFIYKNMHDFKTTIIDNLASEVALKQKEIDRLNDLLTPKKRGWAKKL